MYSFNSASLDVFRGAKELGLTTIYEQTIAPVRVEWQLMGEEFAAWPEWEPGFAVDDFYSPFAEVETQEWELSDVILCGSQFVHEGIAGVAGLSIVARSSPTALISSRRPQTATGNRNPDGPCGF